VLMSAVLVALGAAGGAKPAQLATPGTGVPVPVPVATPVSWAAAQIGVVTSAGILGTDAAGFRPTDPLTRGELADALAAWGKSAAIPVDPTRPVTISELDAQLVTALGLSAAARSVRLAARDAGLAPTSRLGTETVARLLGLRLDHPQGSDNLELSPTQPATRAEAAYSFARALALTPGQVTWLDQLSRTFSVPELTDWQRAVLGRALRFVGYPYVWAGTSETTQKIWSSAANGFVQEPGGFDCSGFVWRVYKTEPFPGAPLLGDILKGRTTFAMSAEVKKTDRIALADLQPGDVVFFGSRGPRSSPNQVGHTGIYVGNGWFVHSSSAGVTLEPLQGRYATTFAWARRPLLEAGLTA